MASTFSDLKIELMGTGEQVGTWGATTNTNLGTAIEEAITGSATVTFSSADITLTLTDTNGTQTARNLRLVCTGTSGGARQLILGSGCQIHKLYLVQNDLADALTIKNTSGTGVTIPAGKTQFVFNDGTNVVEATVVNIDLTSDVTGTLPVANGGTGKTNITAGRILVGNGTSAPTEVAGSASGQLLTWNGSTWTAAAAPSSGVLSVSASSPLSSSGGSTPNISFSGTLSVNQGGTGATTAANARNNLDVPSRAGSGASGTWGISISGSASTASTASYASSAGSATSATTATKLSTTSGSAPSYSARAWVNFNGGGSITIRGSGNVSSITDLGIGNFNVNFSTSMPDANYTVAASGNGPISGRHCPAWVNLLYNTYLSTAVNVGWCDPHDSNNRNDPTYGLVAVFR